MPRPAKPFFRRQTKSWYCSIAGKQIPLGKDKKLAVQKFHELMTNREEQIQNRCTLYELSQSYLDWVEINRSSSIFRLHKHFLKSFIEAVGKRLEPMQLKVHQITKWHESLDVSTTTQSDAVGAVQRMLNWAVEQGYITRNPIIGIKKPKRQRRDVFYTSEQWEQIRSHAKGPFLDLLDFLYLTGCRPQEARAIEARHIFNDLIIFPADESKGKSEPRVIFLVPEAKGMVNRFAAQYPEGPVFRNEKGLPWSKNAVVWRLRRISDKVGFRAIAYGARHSFATNALVAGGVDPISVAHLMGHKDAMMVSRVYSHVAKNPNFLRQQALKAAGHQPITQIPVAEHESQATA